VGNDPVNREDPWGLDDGRGSRGGWPWNGSPLPGYGRQDNKCSIGGSVEAILTRILVQKTAV